MFKHIDAVFTIGTIEDHCETRETQKISETKEYFDIAKLMIVDPRCARGWWMDRSP